MSGTAGAGGIFALAGEDRFLTGVFFAAGFLATVLRDDADLRGAAALRAAVFFGINVTSMAVRQFYRFAEFGNTPLSHRLTTI